MFMLMAFDVALKVEVSAQSHYRHQLWWMLRLASWHGELVMSLAEVSFWWLPTGTLRLGRTPL